MDKQIDKILERLGGLIDKLMVEAEEAPIGMAIKIVALVWLFKWVRRNIK